MDRIMCPSDLHSRSGWIKVSDPKDRMTGRVTIHGIGKRRLSKKSEDEPILLSIEV